MSDDASSEEKRAWQLAQQDSRTPAEDKEMLRCAQAAAAHWVEATAGLDHVRATILLAHAYALVGDGQRALQYARQVFALVSSREDSPAWELALAHAVLAHAAAANDAEGLPPISVSPAHGKLLWLLAGTLGAKRILEIGTLGGYSTIWLARGLAPGGRLITLEALEKHAAVARSNIDRAGLAKLVEIRVGQALATLPSVEGPFDLSFIAAH